ncbi:MAG: hypothetical protein E7449_04420 [Ruminococcaceae bacterium]|nr:hypothetical protein [Oscillospiraceae bacterium]
MTEVFLKLLNMSLSACPLVLAVLVLRIVLKKAPKWSVVLLWGIVALRLVLPFSLESALSLIPSAEPLPREILTGPDFEVSTGIPPVDNRVNDYLGDHYFEGVTVPTNNGLNVMTTLTILWLIGIAVLLAYTAFSYWRIRRSVAAAVVLEKGIFQSERIASPFVLGLSRPRIYLPYGLTETEMQHVIAHERAHIARRDHWWKPLGFLLLSIYWFNPLMWLSYVLLCRDIELACDEKVVKDLQDAQRADYSQALLNCSTDRRAIAACPLAFGEVGVKQRVRSVLSYKKPAFWIVLLAVIACLAAAVCFLTNPPKRVDEAETFSKIYAYDSYLYDGAIYSFTYHPDELPMRLFFRPGKTLSVKSGLVPMPTEDLWHNMDGLTEIKLTKENFDTAFIAVDSAGWHDDNMSAAKLRRQNQTAWRLVDGSYYYDLLLQKDGSVLLGFGYYHPESHNEVRFLFRLKATDEAALKKLTLEDVIALHERGEEITWQDLAPYAYEIYTDPEYETYTRFYVIDEMFVLVLSSGLPGRDERPEQVYLYANDGWGSSADLLLDDVKSFIEQRKDMIAVLTVPTHEYILEVGYSSKAFEKMIMASENRGDMTQSAIQHEPIVKITDRARLDGLINDLAGKLDFDEDFYEAIVQFGDSFFENNTLFMIYATTTHSGQSFMINEVRRFGSEFSVDLALMDMEQGDDALGGWMIFLAVSNDELLGVEEYSASITATIYPLRSTLTGAARYYCMRSSEEIMKPGFALFEDGTFSMTFSMVSSYIGVGTYEMTEDKLTLRTNDGQFVYVFDIVDDKMIFDAEASSEMVWFSGMKDGAVFW